MNIRQKTTGLLRRSEKYFKTDMLYVAREGFWVVAGKTGTFVFSLLLLAAFSNYTSKELYGTYQYILSTVALFSTFSLPGINAALVRSVARKKEGTLRLAIKTKLKYSLLGSFFLLCISTRYILTGNPQLGIPLLIGALFFPLQRTFRIFESFWQGRKQFNVRSKYMVLSAFFSAIIMIPTIYFTESAALIVLAFCFSHSLFEGLFLNITLNRVKNKESDSGAMPYGKHLSLMWFLTSISLHIDRIILWSLLGPVEVAVYSFAYLPVERMKQLCPISLLSLPRLSEKKVKDIKPGILSKLIKLFLILIPAVILIVFISPYIYRLIFPQYPDSIPYFRVLTVLLLFIPFQLLTDALTSEGRKKELYIINFAVPSVKIILFLAFIPMFGAMGIIYALILSNLLNGIMNLYFFVKI